MFTPGLLEHIRFELNQQGIHNAWMINGFSGRTANDTFVVALPLNGPVCGLAARYVSGISSISNAQRHATGSTPEPRRSVKHTENQRLSVAPMGEGGVEQTDSHATPNWQTALAEYGATITPHVTCHLPDPIQALPAVCDVLNQAGERACVTLPEGNTWLIFGFPDLRRAISKVILIATGEPARQVVAVHRYPSKVGTAVQGTKGILQIRKSADKISNIRYGRPTPNGGTLFAVDSDSMYVLNDDQGIRWDGHSEVNEGTTQQTLATLVLHWSRR